MATFSEIINSIKRAITRATPLSGSNCSIEQTENGRIINVHPQNLPPQFKPVKLTGTIDANGFYEGDLYGDGTFAPATQTGIKIWIWGLYIDPTDPQGFWLARQTLFIMGGSEVITWEIIPNLPLIPDTTNNYFLMSLNGVVQWVQAGNCK